MKAIVFDVDETLGSFTQLFIVWKILNKYLQKNNLLPNLIHTQLLFDFLLDIFPLYLRPKILNVFQYLAEQKQQGNIQKVILFTNNQISKEWIQWIAKYIENKVRMKIFDKIIYAYKIKNHFVESERSSHEKLYKDLIKIGQ